MVSSIPAEAVGASTPKVEVAAGMPVVAEAVDRLPEVGEAADRLLAEEDAADRLPMVEEAAGIAEADTRARGEADTAAWDIRPAALGYRDPYVEVDSPASAMWEAPSAAGRKAGSHAACRHLLEQRSMGAAVPAASTEVAPSLVRTPAGRYSTSSAASPTAAACPPS